MKIKLTSTRIINWICVLLILVMVALLFTPYWQYDKTERVDGEKVTNTYTISINDYVWMPREHKEMTKSFEALYENPDDYWINDLVLMPALVLLLGVVVGVISLWYSHVPFSALLALFLGGLGTYSYLTRPEFQLGNPTAHIIVSVVTAVLGLVGVAWFVAKAILNKKKA